MAVSIESIKKKKISLIQFEFGDKMIFSKNSLRDFYQLFQENGYKTFRLVQNGLVEIDSYSANDEIYTGVHYIALLESFYLENKFK